MKEDKDLCINGRVINCKFIKTRSSFNNKVVPLIYTEKKGFSNVLTNFIYIKEAGLLKGGGRAGFFIEPAPDIKFSQKDFVRTYSTNKKFRKIFDEYMSEHLTNVMQSKGGELYTEKQATKSSKDFSEDFEE